ncbi:hypothetical protein ACPOL_3604 [Acidisarcina polymorpha]|uniref:Uncharacterized protein n=1 Tax=Acidisarcina polymorpha TaxID=2211140 RepID=A0A2Z5G1D6_9BACT|nr:hypothetical protein ACPOL_3604 [Acidisarcina polymorpha]
MPQDGEGLKTVACLQDLEAQPRNNFGQDASHRARVIDYQHFIWHNGLDAPFWCGIRIPAELKSNSGNGTPGVLLVRTLQPAELSPSKPLRNTAQLPGVSGERSGLNSSGERMRRKVQYRCSKRRPRERPAR